MMNNEDLADILIERLNDLCHDPEVRADLGKLIEWRAPCSKATAEHPTIQTQAAQPLDPAFDVLLKLFPSLIVNEGPTVGPFTLSHREAELIREHVMGDLRGPNKDEFKTVFQRIDEFVCAKWDAEDDEPDSDANKVHGIRLTTTNWVCENGGDDITGTKEEMEAKAAEYRASLYPGPLVEYKVAVYKP